MKWIMGLLLPTLFSIIALIMLIAKPNPNSVFGYRTLRSTSDERVWYFANKVWSIATILLSLLFCIPTVCLVNCFIEDILTVVLLDMAAALTTLFASIIITQILIRRKFGKKRN
ncbi:MAG: SdpI family protein [Clostridia bacterium]|nr:SdpI family protein [Clostridia bacterium]